MNRIYTKVARLNYDKKERILHIKIIDGTEMTLENIREHYNFIRKLTQNKPYAALIDATSYYKIDAAALKYTSLATTIGRRIAAAHYSLCIANKLTLNFFRFRYKPTIHIEQFKTREEALEWLKTQIRARV